MQRTIQLLGPLANKYGDQPIKFKTNSVRGVIDAVDLAHPGFHRELRRYSNLIILKTSCTRPPCVVLFSTPLNRVERASGLRLSSVEGTS